MPYNTQGYPWIPVQYPGIPVSESLPTPRPINWSDSARATGSNTSIAYYHQKLLIINWNRGLKKACQHHQVWKLTHNFLHSFTYQRCWTADLSISTFTFSAVVHGERVWNTLIMTTRANLMSISLLPGRSPTAFSKHQLFQVWFQCFLLLILI